MDRFSGRYDLAMIAYCAAVAAGPAGSLGWARARRDGTNMVVVGGSSIDELVNRMAGDFKKRRPFSLGMLTAPFAPAAAGARAVSRARAQRRELTITMAVSTGQVGARVNELARVLIALELLAPDVRATLDVLASVETDATAILVWEAALAGATNTTAVDLVNDAASATVKFLDDLQAGLISAAPVAAHGEVSLAGTVLLLSGLAEGLIVLHQPRVVVKPTARWSGAIERVW